MQFLLKLIIITLLTPVKLNKLLLNQSTESTDGRRHHFGGDNN